MTDTLSTHKILSSLTEQEKMDLTRVNPTFVQNERLGLSNRGVPTYLHLWEKAGERYYIPRNLLPHRTGLKDQREEGRKVEFKSKITPRSLEQAKGIASLVAADDGILEAGTGKGKTVMALAAAAQVGTTTLVIVHTSALVNQWTKRIETFLGEKPGKVHGDICDYEDKKIVVAYIQSLTARRYPDRFYQYFGLVITDECHRVGAPLWSQVIGKFPARRRWGLTATPERTDGMSFVFHAHLGEIVCTIKGVDLKPEIIPIFTDFSVREELFKNRYTGRLNMPKLITALSMDYDRNLLIVKLALNSAKKGRKVLILGDRVEQLLWLYETTKFNLERKGDKETIPALYLGETSLADREWAEENADMFFATYPLAKEGLDIPRLDTIIEATPSGNEITVVQSWGRLTRALEGKKNPVVLSLVDHKIDACARLWRKRKNICSKEGYPIRSVS